MTVAVCDFRIQPALTVKVAEVVPAGTVTEAGVLSSLLLPDRAITRPPAGAAPLRDTVQVLLPPEASVVGLHWNAERAAGADCVTTGADTVKLAPFDTPE